MFKNFVKNLWKKSNPKKLKLYQELFQIDDMFKNFVKNLWKKI
jgi:hypothetical protein